MITLEQLDFADRAFAAYITARLLSEVDDDTGEALDQWNSVDDITEATGFDMARDVRDFVESNWVLVKDLDPHLVGNDVWLDRNEYGPCQIYGGGFENRGLGDRGERLAQIARKRGPYRLYVTETGGPVYGTYGSKTPLPPFLDEDDLGE